MPNMKKQTAVTTSPVRTFLRARWRSMSCLGILEVHVGDHRAEQQREVREREQVQAQRRAAVGARGGGGAWSKNTRRGGARGGGPPGGGRPQRGGARRPRPGRGPPPAAPRARGGGPARGPGPPGRRRRGRPGGGRRRPRPP